MARIRSVHPALFTDEAFVSCSPLARLLAIGIWTECDDQGIFEWKIVTLKIRLLPMDTADTGALLTELEGANIVQRYEIDGKALGAVRNFGRFQRPKSPNAILPITDEIRKYVSLAAQKRGTQAAPSNGSSEPTTANAPPFPPKGEITRDERTPVPRNSPKSPQMEDGGWRMEEGEREESARPASERAPDSASPSAPPPRSAGCRLPADWTPKEPGFATNLGLDEPEVLAKFRDYWASIPGQRARRSDWDAGWRNWCRDEGKRPSRTPKATADSRKPNRVSDALRAMGLGSQGHETGQTIDGEAA